MFIFFILIFYFFIQGFQAECLNNCNSHGKCVNKGHFCLCDFYYSGINCEYGDWKKNIYLKNIYFNFNILEVPIEKRVHIIEIGINQQEYGGMIAGIFLGIHIFYASGVMHN